MSYDEQGSDIFNPFNQSREKKEQQNSSYVPESPDEGFEVFTSEDFISNSEEISKKFEKFFRRK